MYSLFFALCLIALLAIDYVFMPRSARKAWFAMAAVFLAAALLSLYQAPLVLIANFLGIGRPVDAFVYLAIVLLIRELFLSRTRFSERDRQFTQLVRAMAIRHAVTVSESAESST